MEAVTIRSGLIESTHPWSAVVVDETGRTQHEWGEPDRPLYYRSSVKVIQATVSIECGATLAPEELAVVCSSHSGTAAQVSLVRRILSSAACDESVLRCPPALPLGAGSRRLAIRQGHDSQRIFHNCSGKHAGFLAASVAGGWSLPDYLAPQHPLQQRVMATVADLTGTGGHPPGVDGCGAPTLRGTIRGLARAFAIVSVDERFATAREAVTRYPALTSGNDRPDGRLAMWWDGPAKGGAEGLMVAARDGVAIATKSHGGSIAVAVQALIAVAHHLGMLSAAAYEALAAEREPPVLGGGSPVGSVLPLDRGAEL